MAVLAKIEAAGGSEPPSFAACRRRLELALAGVADERPWSRRVSGWISSATDFAAADREAALVLTLPASGRRSEDAEAFAAMSDAFALHLLWGAPPASRPRRTARNLVLRVARQVLLQLEAFPREPVTAIAPDLIVFALTPYVGMAEACRLAGQPTATS